MNVRLEITIGKFTGGPPVFSSSERDYSLSHHPVSALEASTQLIHQLFYFLDESNYTELLKLFTPDGRWIRQGEDCSGHQHIMQSLMKRSTTQRIRHVISNTFLPSQTATRATLTAYMTAYRFDDGSHKTGPVTISRPFRLSVVHARLVVVDDHWRVAELAHPSEFEFAHDGASAAASRP